MQMNSFEDSYPLVEFLGSGSFAEVWHGKCNRTGEDVAVKIVDKAKLPNRKRIDSEILVHSVLNHPSIVRLFKSFEDDEHVYLVMELCCGGTLQDYLKSRGGQLTENEAQPFFWQIVEGVNYLHSRGIIHRDLSLSNILLADNSRIKISDFGLAKQLHHRDEKHSTMCGTPNFISPEIVTQTPHGLESDSFSLGCILYTLIVGKPPFDTQGLGSTLRRVRRVDFTIPHFLSPQAKGLISSLLKKDPKERLSLQGILIHPFFQRDHVGFKRNQLAFEGLQDSGLGSTATTFSTATDELPKNEHGRRDNGQLSVILSERSYGSCQGTSVQGRGSRCQSLTSECLKRHDRQLPTETPTNVSSDVYHSQQRQQSVSSHNSSPRRSYSPHPTSTREKSNSPCPHRSCSPYVTCMREQSQSVCSSQPGLSSPQKIPPHRSPCLGISPSPTPSCQLPDNNCGSVRGQASPIIIDSRWPQGCMTLAEIMPPLTTQRLKPTRHRTKNAIINISESGDINLEFFRIRGDQEKILNVCRISPDGIRVAIQRPSKACSPLLNTDTKMKDQSEFTFHNLPKEHWAKYEYAVRFLDLVKAKTPKVTFYSKHAKCILMESRQDFEVLFYDGVKITLSSEIMTIISSNGEFTMKMEVDAVRYPEFESQIDHFRECHEHCINIEGVLALVENKTNKVCFPLVIGKRPTNNIALRDSTKENCAPTSGNTRASDRDIFAQVNLSALNSQPRICNFSDSKILRPNSQASNGRNQVIKKVHIPNLGWAQQEKCGKITVQYQDGSDLELPGRTSDRVFTSPHTFRYKSSEGFCHIVDMSKELDCDLRKKVECLPVFIRNLEESPVLLDIPSRVTSLSGFR